MSKDVFVCFNPEQVVNLVRLLDNEIEDIPNDREWQKTWFVKVRDRLSQSLHSKDMNTLERLKELEAILSPAPWEDDNHPAFVIELRNALPKLLALVEKADILATHVSGILELKAVATPETTKGWLDQYVKSRAALDEVPG